MAPIAFPSRATDSYAEAVRSAATGLDGVKDLAHVPVPRAAELLGQPLRDPFMVSYMDLRRTPGAEHWNTWRVVTLRGRTADPDEVCLWIMRTHDGLSVSYRYPATGPAGAAVPHYVARAQHLMASAATTGHWPLTPNPLSPRSCPHPASRSSGSPSTDAIAHPSTTEPKQDAACLPHSELDHA